MALALKFEFDLGARYIQFEAEIFRRPAICLAGKAGEDPSPPS